MDFRAYLQSLFSSVSLSSNPSAPPTIEQLLDLCAQAGELIVAQYQSHQSAEPVQRKADSTPLTEADLASHRLLSAGLSVLTPDIPILSEESPADAIADRRAWREFWMLDPLDGTKEFLNRTGEFSINLALIVEQRPVLGIIFRPLVGDAMWGLVGQGAYKASHLDGTWTMTEVRARSSLSNPLVLFASKRHRNETLDKCLSFLGGRFELERRNSGSALKFCDLASGEGDCYPRFSACSEWDVAAGEAIVEAAGGKLFAMDGEDLQYNARETLLSPHFLAVADPQAPLWQELLKALRCDT